jgi:hypothetical protein
VAEPVTVSAPLRHAVVTRAVATLMSVDLIDNVDTRRNVFNRRPEPFAIEPPCILTMRIVSAGVNGSDARAR